MRVRTLMAIACLWLGAGSAGAEASSAPGVRVEGSRVSLSGQSMTVTDVLNALGRNSITVDFHGDPSRIAVADAFEDLEVARALGRVLSDHSHILVDHAAVAGQRRIEVFMLGGSDPAPRRFEAQSAASYADSADAVDATDEMLLGRAVSDSAEERTAAAEALAYRGDAYGTPGFGRQVLLQLLSDPEESVRARAIETIKDTADEIPFEALARIAREDQSRERRIQALELLVERSENGESHEPLRIALNDADPTVRRRARELALDWHIALDDTHRSSY